MWSSQARTLSVAPDGLGEMPDPSPVLVIWPQPASVTASPTTVPFAPSASATLTPPPSLKPLRSLKTYLGYTTTPVALKLPLNLQDLVSVALSQQGLPKPQTMS